MKKHVYVRYFILSAFLAIALAAPIAAFARPCYPETSYTGNYSYYPLGNDMYTNDYYGLSGAQAQQAEQFRWYQQNYGPTAQRGGVNAPTPYGLSRSQLQQANQYNWYQDRYSPYARY